MAFPTVQYANDSSGRLTLAVLFSLATQFSEHLSEVVKRGVKSKLGRGVSSREHLNGVTIVTKLQTSTNLTIFFSMYSGRGLCEPRANV